MGEEVRVSDTAGHEMRITKSPGTEAKRCFSKGKRTGPIKQTPTNRGVERRAIYLTFHVSRDHSDVQEETQKEKEAETRTGRRRTF